MEPVIVYNSNLMANVGYLNLHRKANLFIYRKKISCHIADMHIVIIWSRNMSRD